MAILTPKLHWFVELEAAELLLVLKALGGRLKEDEVSAAKALGDRLTQQRAATTDHLLHNNNKLLANLND